MSAAPPTATSSRPGRLLVGQGTSGGILVGVIAVMVFLAAMALAGGMALGTAVDQWREALARDLTIQVPAGPEADSRVAAVVATLTGAPGIVQARALERPELVALLEPWLGAGNVPDDMPLPRLIDVRLAPDTPVDAAGLQARIEAAAPGARVDDPQAWLADVVRLAWRAQAIAATAVGLVLGALVAVVVFATRAGLAANREVVDVLHLVGARDAYIAGEFQRHFLGLGVRGAVAGLAATGLALAPLVGLELGGAAAFLPRLALSGWQWLALVALVPLVAGMTTLTARLTVRRALARVI